VLRLSPRRTRIPASAALSGAGNTKEHERNERESLLLTVGHNDSRLALSPYSFGLLIETVKQVCEVPKKNATAEHLAASIAVASFPSRSKWR
jgi:hypothetical protein